MNYPGEGTTKCEAEAMAERKKQLTREQQRAEVKKRIARSVRPWPMGLELNISRVKRLAEDEWNFEKLFDQVRTFAGGSISREI